MPGEGQSLNFSQTLYKLDCYRGDFFFFFFFINGTGTDEVSQVLGELGHFSRCLLKRVVQVDGAVRAVGLPLSFVTDPQIHEVALNLKPSPPTPSPEKPFHVMAVWGLPHVPHSLHVPPTVANTTAVSGGSSFSRFLANSWLVFVLSIVRTRTGETAIKQNVLVRNYNNCKRKVVDERC